MFQTWGSYTENISFMVMAIIRIKVNMTSWLGVIMDLWKRIIIAKRFKAKGNESTENRNFLLKNRH